MSPGYQYIQYLVLVFASLTFAHLSGHPIIAHSRKGLHPEVKFQASDHNMLKHWRSRVSTLTLICRAGFLHIQIRVKNLRTAGHTGRARLLFWKAGFPQFGPAVSEKAWVSPAGPKGRRTGRLGTLIKDERIVERGLRMWEGPGPQEYPISLLSLGQPL